MSFDYLTNEARATEFLASHLSDGTLVVFLGAGASIGCGLPDWVALIQRVRTKAGLGIAGIGPTTASEDLQAAADEVLRDVCENDEMKFAELVKKSLYEDVTLTGEVMKHDLLIALGALMMGSRRGSVTRVVTFNFDSLLEWYLSLYGFVARVVVQPPMLEGAEDVRIYHPHGYLPHPDQGFGKTSPVILGLSAIDQRLGTPGEPWFELLRHLLKTGVCLFVGMSARTFRDRALSPLLQTVGRELKDVRPTGFWLLRDEADRSALEREFLGRNVVPIFHANYSDRPSFLLGICRRAAESLKI